MNIVNFGAEVRTMTSREIAELTGKQHKDVLYDIRKMLDELGLRSADFSADLPDSYGRMQPGFQLPKRGSGHNRRSTTPRGEGFSDSGNNLPSFSFVYCTTSTSVE